MRRLHVIAFSVLLLPLLAQAQSQFDGTWKIDMNSVQLPKKPDVLLLQNGMYECKSCVPPISIKADGTDQKVTGHPYFDTMSMKVIDDHNVEGTTKRDGKVVGTEMDSISADGNTLDVSWTDSGQPSGGTQSGHYTSKRVAKGPAGANLLSGSWRGEKAAASSDAITWTYKVNGNELTMTNPTGQSYTAKLDGTEAPYKGDPGTTGVSLKMLGKDTLEETDKREDKIISISKMTVASDGKSAKIVVDDTLHGTQVRATAMKQ
ncbi:MAG TPA: hypothetical protein VMB66_16135 [Candidatus Acidoferrales bacterium]|nr:hypothetical protein [Candidatus Acidoferrales bacterium]